MDIERVVDFTITLVSLGGSAYLAYHVLKRAGFIKPKTKIRIRGKMVSLGQAEMECFSSTAVDPSQLETTFDMVGGHEAIKATILRNVVFPFHRPDLFPVGTLRSPPKGLLLYGPPGTGKTMLAKAIAKEADAFFMDVRIESLFSKWVGESEQNTAAIFCLAKLCQPTIIFIDEIDSLLSERGHSAEAPVYSNAKTIFLRHWDGFHSSNDRIVVIGATNMPHVLDAAVLRRMPIQIEVPLPTAGERQTILKTILCDENTDMCDLETIVQWTDTYSGSDLRALCVDACSHMIYEAVRRGNPEVTMKLTMAHFEESLRQQNASKAKKSPEKEEAFCPIPESWSDVAGVSQEKLRRALPLALMLVNCMPSPML